MNSPKKFHGLSVSKIGNKFYLFYQELSEQKNNRNCPVLVAQSKEGLSFKPAAERLTFRKYLLFKKEPRIDDLFQITRLDKCYYIFYKRPGRNNKTKLAIGTSDNGFDWSDSHQLEAVQERAVVLKGKKSVGPFLMFFGERSIKLAVSPDLANWTAHRKAIVRAGKDGFDNLKTTVGNAFLTKDGIVLLYVAQNKRKQWGMGAALLDKDKPTKVLWRSGETLWRQPKKWKSIQAKFIGAIQFKGEILAYWEHEDELLVSAIPPAWEKFQSKPFHARPFASHSVLEKYMGNPIIKPDSENFWESYTTFNPTAVCIDGKVHLLYRAVGEGGLSVFGYAASSDGLNIEQRLKNPVYVPKEHFEFRASGAPAVSYPYMSGGGWGGCEDPRLTLMDDRIFLTYTAFNGCQPPGVALTSIATDDFLAQKWNWKKPQLLSKPGEIQKNWMVFPEKIKGKYAILHSINPTISIDYFDNLDEAGPIESRFDPKGDDRRWDNMMRGAAAPPIKTEYGWLLFYHAMDRRDPNHCLGGYWNKVGAMILDYANPSKVLFRCFRPILEADRHYERQGAVAGAVYVCGSVVRGDDLLVYYGGADSVGCVAKAPMKKFLKSLTNDKCTFAFNKITA